MPKNDYAAVHLLCQVILIVRFPYYDRDTCFMAIVLRRTSAN